MEIPSAIDPLIPEKPLEEHASNTNFLYISITLLMLLFCGLVGFYAGRQFGKKYHYVSMNVPLGPINPRLQEQQKQTKQIAQTLSLLPYQQIPQTDLELKLPQASQIDPKQQTPSFYTKDTMHILYTYNLWDFTISSIDTATSAATWVLDNTLYQGQTLREIQDQYGGTATFTTINNFPFLSIETECCGGYELVYLYDYFSKDGHHSLLAFSTRNTLGEIWTEDNRNTILDTILLTLRKKI